MQHSEPKPPNSIERQIAGVFLNFLVVLPLFSQLLIASGTHNRAVRDVVSQYSHAQHKSGR
jgi:hypothetical protein